MDVYCLNENVTAEKGGKEISERGLCTMMYLR